LDIFLGMPLYTEARIRQLCHHALSARHEQEVKRLGKELRFAIREHIHLAKESLASHVKTFPIVDAMVSGDLSKLPFRRNS
jgi:hypothetical protein